MDNNVLSATIGLAGVLIGALIAGWVTYISAKHQTQALKDATERQINEQKAQVLQSNSHNISVSKSSSFMERYSCPSYMEIRDEVEMFLAESANLSEEEKLHECLLICRRDTKESVFRFNRIHALGMFFGEIGVSFENEHLNCDGLAIFDRIIPYYWKELGPFIRACHKWYGFPLDDAKSLAEQELIMFTKFRFAYTEMVRNGLAKEPPLPTMTLAVS